MQTAQLHYQLETLTSSGLLRQLLSEPELEYIFKHALTHEATYQSLLLKQRRQIHELVAQCYEAILDSRPDEHAAIIAYHYDLAGDDAKTLHYATLAGDAAASRYASAEATMQYTRPLDAAQRVETDADQLTHLYARTGRMFELSGRYADALANYEAMEMTARLRHDRSMELASLIARATIYSAPTTAADVSQEQALSDQALALSRKLGDRVARGLDSPGGRRRRAQLRHACRNYALTA